MTGSRWLHELYDASYDRLVLQLFAFCGDLADAEDAVQEAFVKAIGQGRAFDRVQNPEAWPRTVALNHQRNSWRHANVVRKFMPVVPGALSTPQLGPDHVAVVRALAELDLDLRQVLVLRYLADLGCAEIAHELGVPRARSSLGSPAAGSVWPRYSTTECSAKERSLTMSDLDVLRDLAGQFRRPEFEDLVAVSGGASASH